MSFWTGLEAVTGHRPGSLRGMSWNDFFDNEKWTRLQRTWSGKPHPQGETQRQRDRDLRTNRGGEPMYTKWYTGRTQLPLSAAEKQSAESMLAAGELQENQESESSRNPDMFGHKTHPDYQRAFDAVTLANQQRRDALWPSGPSIVQALRPSSRPVARVMTPPWSPPTNEAERIQEIGPYLGMGDPYSGWGGYLGSDKQAHMGMGASGYEVPLPGVGRDRPLPLATKKTVRETFADPDVSNKVTETIEEKVPTGSAQWGNSQNPPNAYSRSLMNMFSLDAWKDLARRNYERRMKRRAY